MNKNEILNKLKELDLDKDKYIILSGASLVVQGIISDTIDIDLATTKDYYKTINWETKIGAFGTQIKYFDIFEIGDNLFEPNEVITIDGYHFANLKYILKIKKELNRPKDFELIKELEKILK